MSQLESGNYDINTLSSKVFTLDYFMKNDVCRLCWSEIPKGSISNKSKLITSIADNISFCLGIVVTKETIPNRLCIICYNHVRKFAKFKLFCRKSNELLKKILENHQGNEKSHLTSSKEHILETKAKVKCEIEILDEQQDIKIETSDQFPEVSETPENDSDDEITLSIIRDNKNIKKNTENPITQRAINKLFNRNKCRICVVNFSKKAELDKHNLIIHDIENDIFKCFGCAKSFKNRKARHGHETNVCKNLRDGYHCKKCDDILLTRKECERHRYNHFTKKNIFLPKSVKFKCKSCKENFGSIYKLKEHKKIHMQQLDFVCETCGRVFARKDYLSKHMATHTGARGFHCPHCSYTTCQQSSLVVHIRKHTGERPYSCDLCPLKCISSSNLLAHRRRHFGVKNFQCTICGKQFGYKQSLENHISSNHGQPKRLPCPRCGATYRSKRDLNRHLQRKHPDFSAVKKDSDICVESGKRVEVIL